MQQRAGLFALIGALAFSAACGNGGGETVAATDPVGSICRQLRYLSLAVAEAAVTDEADVMEIVAELNRVSEDLGMIATDSSLEPLVAEYTEDMAHDAGVYAQAVLEGTLSDPKWASMMVTTAVESSDPTYAAFDEAVSSSDSCSEYMALPDDLLESTKPPGWDLNPLETTTTAPAMGDTVEGEDPG